MNRTKPILNIGDRLVIHGMSGFVARVESLTWSSADDDWLIRVNWDDHGKSRVWAHDEGTVWRKWIDLN